MPRPEVSLVIPIYNEEEVLPQLDERLGQLLEKLGVDAEVVFVDDGSKDASLEILRAMVAREPRYRAVSFARNFGHQRAITCGMDATRGKSVVVMDADLQDPPEVIVEMLAKWREGYDVVYGRRRSREGETAFKLFTAKIFYRVFAAMIPIEVPLDTGDFRLMSRRVVVAMRELRETHRFVRGLVAWVGFKQTAVEYDRAARAAGETKYPLRKMLAFAFDGIASFSILPLRLATYMGLLVGVASVLYAISAVIAHFGFDATVPGWTTTVVLMSALSSVQLIVIGVLGEYVGRIYEQVKGRPLYVVGERLRHRKMRARAETQEFASVGAVRRATDRPPAAAPAVPPPAPGAAPAPSVAPPPVAPVAPAAPPASPAAPVAPVAPPASPASPVASSPPPAPIASPVASSPPPPLPPRATISGRPPAPRPSGSFPAPAAAPVIPPPPALPTSADVPSVPPPPVVVPSVPPPPVASVPPPSSGAQSAGAASGSQLASKPPPPLPAAAKNRDKP